MIRGLRGWLLVGIVIAAMTGTVSLVARAAQDRSPATVAGEMRQELGELRENLEACLQVQDRLEGGFDELADRTRRLREDLDRLEGLDSRGVPAEHYEDYLELVDEYNESIPRWEERAEALRRQSTRCRALVEIHNERADSLRSFLVEEGLLESPRLD